MAKNTITHTINGREYVCAQWCAIHAMASRGPNILMAVSAADEKAKPKPKPFSELSREEFAARLEDMKRDLQQVMVKPRLVDEYTDDAGCVTWQEMGDDFAALHKAVTSPEVEAIEGFPESSEDRKE
jgi:hypothetical protein